MNVPPDWRNHIDFAQPVKLHYNFRKFWEITLLEEFVMTNIRCGKLLPNLAEDENSIQEASKSHDGLEEAKEYVLRHIELKLEKGYNFMPIFVPMPEEPQEEEPMHVEPPPQQQQQQQKEQVKLFIPEQPKREEWPETKPEDLVAEYGQRNDDSMHIESERKAPEEEKVSRIDENRNQQAQESKKAQPKMPIPDFGENEEIPKKNEPIKKPKENEMHIEEETNLFQEAAGKEKKGEEKKGKEKVAIAESDKMQEETKTENNQGGVKRFVLRKHDQKAQKEAQKPAQIDLDEEPDIKAGATSPKIAADGGMKKFKSKQNDLRSEKSDTSEHSKISDIEAKNAKTTKHDTKYSIHVLPPSEEKTKDTSIDKNALKRRAPEPIANDQLKRKKTLLEEDGDMEISYEKYDEHEKKRKNSDTSSNKGLVMEPEEVKDIMSPRSAFKKHVAALKNSATTAATSAVSKKGEFKGEYLEHMNAKNQIKFFQIQVLDKYVKTESGNILNSKFNEIGYTQYYSAKDALTAAEKTVAEMISQGYYKVPNKFVYSFDISEITVGREHKEDPGDYKSDQDSPKQEAHKSGKTTPSRVVNAENFTYEDDENVNIDWMGFGLDDYSETSRRTGFDYDEDSGSLGLDTRAKTSQSEASKKKNVIVEPNKDTTLGKPLKDPYPSLLLAQNWDKKIDPKGYYMSEKLDGVRCFWTGTQLFSRNAKRYYPPKWWTKNIPGSPLDGELWIARGKYKKCADIVKQTEPDNPDWNQIQFVVFDAPNIYLPFKRRLQKLEEVFDRIDSPYITLHKQEICKGRDHLEQELERIEKLGGEGLMLRDPESNYEPKRSKTLLKVKNFEDDEAVVVGIVPGAGKFEGMMGSLKVKNSEGIVFTIGIGFSEAQRKNPPKIGAKITYRYQGSTQGGKPKTPSFLREYVEL